MKTPEQELADLGYQQELKRSMGLWQLTAYGLNYMIPIAPAMIFGFVLIDSGGTVALPYLLAGIAMAFTAISYSIMVKKFPLAGSLYNYISRGWHPHLGFFAGWLLLLDYIFIPTLTAMSASLYAQHLFPHVPYALWLLVFSVSMGLLNLLGIQFMAIAGVWLLLLGELVIFVGFAVWSYTVSAKGVGVGTLWSLEPFRFTSIATLASATSLAVQSYLGYDAITTLSEEANNPKRDIPRAIYLCVLIGGFTMFVTGYLAMLAIPNWQQHMHDQNWLAVTLFHVAEKTGGHWFTLFYTSGFLIAMGVFNVVATAAGARLLFSMGRDGVLPRKIFAAVNKRFQTPHWNIVVIVLLEYFIGMSAQVDSIANLVNFGALTGFMLLNLSVIWFYFIRKQDQNISPSISMLPKYFLAPLLGFIVVAWVFGGLERSTMELGFAWGALGIAYMAVKWLTSQYKSSKRSGLINHPK